MKQKKLKDIWSSEAYLKASHKGSLDADHLGMRILKNINSKSKKILDLGCGEGTRLSHLSLPGQKESVGIDVSKAAISLAKNKDKNINFVVGDLKSLPFKDNYFDIAYSAFVLEHVRDPERVIKEAIRVTKVKGDLIFIAPNYGAPNRSSPPFGGSRIEKFIKGILLDFKRVFIKNSKLEWNKVEPATSPEKYESDLDTTIEPYAGSLVSYLESLGISIKNVLTCWEHELPGVGIHQRVFRLLGEVGFYPFFLWGPHLVVHAVKISNNPSNY